jgi:hypothetical protein
MLNYVGSFVGAVLATYSSNKLTLLPSLVANTGAVISTQFFTVAFMVVPKLFWRVLYVNKETGVEKRTFQSNSSIDTIRVGTPEPVFITPKPVKRIDVIKAVPDTPVNDSLDSVKEKESSE